MRPSAAATLLLLAALSAAGQSQLRRAPAAASPAEVRIPTSWLQKARGYEKALELQKATGADIFIWFSRQAPSSEKGLCQWFENKGLNDQKVRKYLRDYIKVAVPLPANPDCQKLAEAFDVGKCPIVFIVQTNGWRQPCRVFDWSRGKPELFPAEELIELFRARSGERYQEPAE